MLHHLEINVSNLQRSTLFWGWLLEELDYAVFQQWEQGISWKYQDTYLVFVQTEDLYADKPYHRKQVGLNHLAFHAKSREQVDEMAQKLADKGVSLLYQDRYPHAGGQGHYAVFFEDPDRIKVEIVAPCG